MKKHYKTATELQILKEENRENRCCIIWRNLTSSIKVNSFNSFSPQEIYQAKCVEELLKYMIGNYCPSCGKQLRK